MPLSAIVASDLWISGTRNAQRTLCSSGTSKSTRQHSTVFFRYKCLSKIFCSPHLLIFFNSFSCLSALAFPGSYVFVWKSRETCQWGSAIVRSFYKILKRCYSAPLVQDGCMSCNIHNLQRQSSCLWFLSWHFSQPLPVSHVTKCLLFYFNA